jgi:hypothetical protein
LSWWILDILTSLKRPLVKSTNRQIKKASTTVEAFLLLP